MMAEPSNDDALFAALKHAVRARQAVPPDFISAGKDAFAWSISDAELAQLTYDSARDLDYASGTRTEAASIRALTFASAHLTIELEVTSDSLVGQVLPVQPATVWVQTDAGPQPECSAEENGCFLIQPIPAVPFRLQCRTATDIDVRTGWITL